MVAQYKISKLLMVFAVMILVSGCSSTDDEASMDGSATGAAGAASDSALSDVYGDAVSPGTQADLETNVGDRVFFGYDSYELSPEARATLEKQAQWLAQYSTLSITVEGHADERGTREYNLALGERRANSVKNYLVALGVDGGRVNTISYGKERPLVAGSDDTSWAQNRRGMTKVN
jgi:peptidoglycan-associated lipoprotein